MAQFFAPEVPAPDGVFRTEDRQGARLVVGAATSRGTKTHNQDVFLLRLSDDDPITAGGVYANSGGGGGMAASSVVAADFGPAVTGRASSSSSRTRPKSGSSGKSGGGATQAAPLPRPSGAYTSPQTVDIVAVFDGHGPLGGRFAEYSAQAFSTNADDAVTAAAIAGGSVGEALADATRATDGDALAVLQTANLVPPDSSLSTVGGTCVGAGILVNNSTLYTLTLGDCRTIVFLRSGAGDNWATVDQTAREGDEIARVRGLGGVVLHGRVVGPRGCSMEPTRSLGDWDMRPLLSCTPVVEPRPPFQFAQVAGFLVGSDGVFEGCDEGEVAAIARAELAQGRGPSSAAAAVVEAAIEARRRREPEAQVDNTTAACASFH